MTTRQLLENMNRYEFSEWQAFFEIMSEGKKEDDNKDVLQMKLMSAFTKENR